jgi:hypothetical protein
MKYEVVWETPTCFEEVNALMAAGLPAVAVKEAVQRIAEELQADPQIKGRELSEGLRCIDIPPFRAYFDIDIGKMRVMVSFLRWRTVE